MNGPDEIWRRGLFAVVPEDVGRHVGRAVVASVLVYVAEHADAAGLFRYSTRTMAAEFALDRRTVRAALDVLTSSGRIVRTGTRRRTTEYRLAVESWPPPVRHPRLWITADSAGDNPAPMGGLVGGQMGGLVGGQMGGISRPGMERKGKESSGRANEPAVDSARPATDDDTHRYRHAALAKLPEAWPPNGALCRALERARHDGHNPHTLTDYLDQHINRELVRNVPAVAVRLLSELEPPARRWAPPRPWCGRCDRDTRMLEDEAGRPCHCPVCHPLAPMLDPPNLDTT